MSAARAILKYALVLAAVLAATPAGALAGDDGFEPVVLGKGTNLAHWLSQTRRTGAERRGFITERDIADIAALGFDHVRLPLDEMQMWHEDGSRDEDAFATLHDGIRWSLAQGLKVVVDLHILRSHHFNAEDKPLCTSISDALLSI